MRNFAEELGNIIYMNGVGQCYENASVIWKGDTQRWYRKMIWKEDTQMIWKHDMKYDTHRWYGKRIHTDDTHRWYGKRIHRWYGNMIWNMIHTDDMERWYIQMIHTDDMERAVTELLLIVTKRTWSTASISVLCMPLPGASVEGL